MKPDPLSCEPKDTIPHSTGLIRSLAMMTPLGGLGSDISDSDLLVGLEHMVRLRIFDDRMMKMQRTGKLSFYMRSLGESGGHRPDDGVGGTGLDFPNISPAWCTIRERQGHGEHDLPLLGREDNVKGRQMPVHYYREEVHIRFNPVGAQFSQAVGVAMASAYKGLDEVTITWIGDGASAEGDYHYALNCSVFRPPVILRVVNNQWTISTHANLASGSSTFADGGLHATYHVGVGMTPSHYTRSPIGPKKSLCRFGSDPHRSPNLSSRRS